MTKFKDYYYTIKIAWRDERNKNASIKFYSWCIRNKEGEVLQQSENSIRGKEEAQIDCEENINEYYY